MTESATFTAEVARVQTLADGGLRVTFDLPESDIEAVAMLMAFKRFGIVGRVTYAPITHSKTVENNAVEKGPKRKSKWAAAETQDAHKDT